MAKRRVDIDTTPGSSRDAVAPGGGPVRDLPIPAGLRPGWYRVACRTGAGSGLDSPVWLQWRLADGSPLGEFVAALPDPGHAGHATVLLTLPDQPVSALRVRAPEGGQLAPDLGLELVPQSRAAVALRLFAAMRVNDGLPAMFSAGVAVALAAVRGRLPAGLAALARRYRQGQRRAALDPSGRGSGRRWQVTLGRLSGPPIPTELLPLHQLRLLEDAAGSSRWLASGEDPRLLLSPADLDGPLPAGWYLVEGCIKTHGGRVLSPCLYPDYGRGHEHSSLILLPDPDPDAGGLVQSLVLLKYPVASLRFDPSTRRCEFSLAGFSLRRIGRTAALASMLAEVSRVQGRWSAPAALRAGAQFLARLVRSGVTRAGEQLFSAYQDARRQGASSYETWVRLYDTITTSDIERMRERAAAIAGGPLISVLVPVYETPLELLRLCINSVREQAYGNWELCIADDASPSQAVRDFLLGQARLDPRIRVAFRDSNGHISEASNTALAMARGEYVALLDHDDELRPHALLEVAEALVARPGLELVYSDEDKVDASGRRNQPYFKPDWNPDLLRSQNYLCHLTTIRTERARAVGGFRAGFEGSQDHDLFLRCTEGLRDDQVHHIPRILYHWRAVAGSTALDRGSKDYAADAGARAVADHLRRTGTGATVEQLPHGHYRVHWPVPSPAPRVSLVIPTRDRADLLRTCVQSILTRTRYPDFELVIVDNRSSEPDALEYLASLAAEPRVRMLRYDDEFNYSAINNFAVGTCDSELIGLVNNGGIL